MHEIDRLQTIMIAKAVCALHSIQRSTAKYKNNKRALNKIERVSNQTLHELDALMNLLESARAANVPSILRE